MIAVLTKYLVSQSVLTELIRSTNKMRFVKGQFEKLSGGFSLDSSRGLPAPF